MRNHSIMIPVLRFAASKIDSLNAPEDFKLRLWESANSLINSHIDEAAGDNWSGSLKVTSLELTKYYGDDSVMDVDGIIFYDAHGDEDTAVQHAKNLGYISPSGM